MFTWNQIINFFRYSEVIGDDYAASVNSNGEINVTKRYCLKNFEK